MGCVDPTFDSGRIRLFQVTSSEYLPDDQHRDLRHRAELYLNIDPNH